MDNYVYMFIKVKKNSLNFESIKKEVVPTSILAHRSLFLRQCGNKLILQLLRSIHFNGCERTSHSTV